MAKQKTKNPKMSLLNYIDVTRGYRVISKIFFLVCLLFMGNNEFNLILYIFTSRGRDSNGEKKWNWYSGKPRQD